MEHVAQEQIVAFARQRLDAGEMLVVSDHFDECETCRRQLERITPADAPFFDLRSEVFGQGLSAHLTNEEMANYVDKALTGEELQSARDHLANCERCAVETDDLRSFRNEIAPSLDREFRPLSASAPNESWWHRASKSRPKLFGISPLPAFGATLGVLLVAVFGWLIIRTQIEKGPKQEVVVLPSPAAQPSTAPTPTVEQPTRATVAQLNDGEGTLTLDDKGNLSGADYLPTAYQDRLRRAIANQRVEKSAQLDGLTRPTSSLMSSDQETESLSVLDPAGDVVMTTQPTFRWTRMAAATGYVVEIYDEKFQLVLSSPQLTDTSWTTKQSLTRGKVYSWQVKATKGGEEVISPRPPAPQAKFRILDQAKANEIGKAKRSYGSSHLTMALLYAEAGLLKESEQELRQLQKTNPESELVRKLLRQVQALRRKSE